MRIALGADHAGFALKAQIKKQLVSLRHEILDVGTHSVEPVDYPDFAGAVGLAVRDGKAERGVIVCGSGVGASVAANKIRGVRAGLCHDHYSAHQGVEHDDMNVLVLGGRIIGEALAMELVEAFIGARFSAEERHQRRLDKVLQLERRFAEYDPVLYTYYSMIIGGGLFIGMYILIEAGRRSGLRRTIEDATAARSGLGALDAAVFSLLGLLIAFSFSGAAVRFDARRQLAIQEANCIGTAWLRIDVLPAHTRHEVQDQFRRYLDARISVAEKFPDMNAAREELRKCDQIQKELWSSGVAACADAKTPAPTTVFLPALNQMFDIASSRTYSAQMHPPTIIFVMLVLMALASAWLAGHGLAAAKKPSRIHIVLFAAAVATAVLVIVDLEYPRAGLIRLDAIDKFLIELRRTMDAQP